MTTRRWGLFPAIVLAVAACSTGQAPDASTGATGGAGASATSGSTGGTPAASAGGSAESSASPGGSAGASGSVGASGSPGASGSGQAGGAPDLFGTDYPQRRTEGQPGGTIVVADWQEANLFNPYYYNNVTEADVSITFNAGLVVSTDDYKYAPDLATAIPTLENGGVQVPGADGDAMTVTWKLRDGLKWSDGEPLDCSDFAFTLAWIMNEENVGLPAGKTGYEDIREIECASPTDMIWHFDKRYEAYIILFPAPLPEHYLKDIPIAEALTGRGYLPDELPRTPVSGPFKFESVTPGSEIRLVRNDQYVAASHGGPAYLDSLVFKWYADADTMIAGAQGAQPQFDLAKDLNDADLPKLVGLEDRTRQIDSLTYEFLRPNWSEDECSRRFPERGDGCPMSDPALRRALKFAIDRQAINDRLLGGTANLGVTAVSPNSWFYVEPTEEVTFDPDQARQILDEAGWTDTDGDGVREKDGLRAQIEMCTTTKQSRVDALTLVGSWLRDVGVEAVAAPVSSTDIFAAYNESTPETPCALSRGNFDLALHGFSVPLDPLANFPTYHSSQVPPEGGNDARVRDEEIDRILETVRETVDFGEVRELMADYQRVYVEKTVEVPLYFRKEVYIVNPKLQNFTGNPTATGPLWNVQDWWLQE